MIFGPEPVRDRFPALRVVGGGESRVGEIPPRARARAGVFFQGTRVPVSPSESQSDTPPTSKTTAGRPCGIASILAMPKGSGQIEGRAATRTRR